MQSKGLDLAVRVIWPDFGYFTASCKIDYKTWQEIDINTKTIGSKMLIIVLVAAYKPARDHSRCSLAHTNVALQMISSDCYHNN
jgi:hypothetical protein